MSSSKSVTTIFTRRELYNLVWSKPITTITKEYACSYHGLRKICKEYNIPTPKGGHWSKLRHGKESSQDRLPNGDNVKIDLAELNKTNESSNSLKKQKKVFEDSKLNFSVPKRLTKPHYLVKEARSIMKDRKPIGFGPGRDIIYSRGDCISIEVTEKYLSRALRLWNALIKLLLKRGHSISETKTSEFLIFGESIWIRVREVLKREKIEDTSWDRYEMYGSGVLSIKIEVSYNEKEFRDKKSKTIEEQLPDIIAKLELMAREEIKERIERQERWKKIEKEEAIKKAREEKVTTELNNFKQLFETADRWHRSQYLRNYINEFERYAVESNSLDSHKRDWIAWAKEKADWYDPFIEKEVDLLSEIDRETLNKRKSKF